MDTEGQREVWQPQDQQTGRRGADIADGTGRAPHASPTSYTTWSTRAPTQLQVPGSVEAPLGPLPAQGCRPTVSRALLATGSMWGDHDTEDGCQVWGWRAQIHVASKHP